MIKKYNLPKTIIMDDNPLIRQYSKTVTFPLSNDDLDLIEKMQTYLKLSKDEELCKKYKLREGIGISAIQIGAPKKIVVLDFEYDNIEYKHVLINPKIIKHSLHKCFLGTGEGCLSVEESVQGPVYRHMQITVQAKTLNEEDFVLDLTGLPAIVLQHELDHLIGVLFTDYLNNITNNEPGNNPTEIGRSNE